MTTKRRFVSALAICSLAACMPLSGCVAGAGEGSDTDSTESSGDEHVGEAQDAFAESTCATDYSGATIDATVWGPGATTGVLESGVPPYGDSLCTEAFKVQYSHAPYAGCTMSLSWNHQASVTLPNNATDCNNSYMRAITYDNLGNVVADSGKKFASWFFLLPPLSSFCALPASTSISGTSTKLSIAQAVVAQCFTDPVTHKLICLHGDDGVSTQMSCPAF